MNFIPYLALFILIPVCFYVAAVGFARGLLRAFLRLFKKGMPGDFRAQLKGLIWELMRDMQVEIEEGFKDKNRGLDEFDDLESRHQNVTWTFPTETRIRGIAFEIDEAYKDPSIWIVQITADGKFIAGSREVKLEHSGLSFVWLFDLPVTCKQLACEYNLLHPKIEHDGTYQVSAVPLAYAGNLVASK